MYQIFFEKSAEKKLLSLPLIPQKRIIEKIAALAGDPRPHGSIKLTNLNDYRIRIGDYRVIYNIRDEILTVLIIKIDPRKQVYK